MDDSAPTTLHASIVSRLVHAQRLRSPALRGLELARCRVDPVYWINAWGWTYDPRPKANRADPATPNLPFTLWAKQSEFVRWLQAREQAQESGLAEKSRDTGMTWLCAAYGLHCWLFKPGHSVGFGSHKLLYVDSLGNPNSIFEKIRYMLYRLPDWMLPKGFARKKHDNLARLVNPETGATIVGEGGDEIGRGGRASLYFIDEAAHIEHPQMVDSSLAGTTNVRIDVSTPNGVGNSFYRKRHSGTIPVFTLHWRDDPRKDEAWYEAKKRELGDPVVVATQLDIDYTASVENICIPASWVQAAIGLQLPASGPVVCGFDIADEGANKTVLIFRTGPVVRMPVSWGQVNTTQTAWKAKEHIEQAHARRVFYDAGGGYGAAVKGTWNSMERRLSFEAVAVNTGSTPSNVLWPDGLFSHQKFTNLRSELWSLLRARFERTYEFVALGVAHKPEDLISIPAHPQLVAELSTPRRGWTNTGKIELEKKKDMKSRGVASPDFGDALALSEMAYVLPEQQPFRMANGGVLRPGAVV